MKKYVDGVLVDLTAEEITEYNTRLANIPSDFDVALNEVRIKRNRLIAETDYLALSDQTLSSAMSTYRTNLRNITNGLTTVDDIENLTWPTKPSE